MAGSAASSQVSTAAELVAALGVERLLGGWKVRAEGPGWLELEVSGLARGRGPVISVLVWPEVWREREALAPHLIRARSGAYGLMLVGRDDEFAAASVEELIGDGDVAVLAVPASPTRVALALRSRAESVALRLMAAGLELELERAHHENDMLISIGRALSQQRDIHSLLEIILRRCREVTGADAGSVYVVEGDEDEAPRQLRFTVSQNDSRTIESKGFTMPVSASSIVGMCVLSSDVINIPDLYALDQAGAGNNPWGFVHDRSFDEKYAYQTRSMLTVPMISARTQVIGVIQLINKRAKGAPPKLEAADDFDRWVSPFNDVSVAYATSLASQAGIALENAMLYDEVRTLFEGFVRASVTAIESRDPTTSGHSERVADLTVGLAKAIDRVDGGPYRGMTFSTDELKQLEYAALLHDFGKVGVREHILVKAKKLYEHQREMILQRFELIRRGFEVEGLKRRVEYLAAADRDRLVATAGPDDVELAARLAEMDEFVTFILTANEPTVLDQGGFERIADIASRQWLDREGVARPYLEPDEAHALQILRGSLTDAERDEINSHVVHTYNFLREIPWGRTFRDIPEIAGAHHEKLNGTGYPRRLSGDAIPVPARMMTISDIYDALTAKDRPYKKAIPTEKALSILEAEVKRELLDAELFRVFCEARVFEISRH
ncbi:MAG: GAF domain-containing protein [Myxococcales bacterium]|nr:GAF domain-containing protein [Myxococcales bacterium]